MKNSFYISALVVALLVTVGSCARRRNLSPYGWTPAGGVFDTLTLRAESLYLNLAPEALARLEPVVADMEKMAAENPRDPVTAQRSAYWRGRLAYRLGDHERGLALMDSALHMTDSARYPYDYNRIKWNLDMDYHEPTVDRYEQLTRDYEFFVGTGDCVIAAGLAMELGCFLDNIGATEEGIPYLDRADSLFRLAGAKDQMSGNRINHADALRISGDTAGAIRVLRSALADTVTPLAQGSLDIALGNLYALDERDTVSLRRAYELVEAMPGMEEARGLYATYLADEARKRGDASAQRAYMDTATHYLPAIETPEYRREYYQQLYLMYDALGMTDSAYKYLEITATLNDSINTSANRVEVCNALLAGRIRELRQQKELERSNAVVTTLGICFCVFVILIAVCLWIWRKLQRQRMAEVRSELELERSNRRLLANEVLIKEKDRLLREMEDEMTRLSQRGEISGAAVSRIGSAIRSHTVMKPNRDSFAEVFGEVNPRFADRLLGDYPMLTAADIRLASYIVTGMENKHIAGVLGIRPESVKQARWRLRSKFALPNGTSLEAFLRNYTFGK